MRQTRAGGGVWRGRLLRAARALFATLLVGGMALAPARPAAAAASWSIVPSTSPTSPPNGSLVDLACPSATSCFAVGMYENVSGGHPLVEHWDGTSWSVMTVPFTPGYSRDIALRTISCPSTTSCMAASGGPQGMRWDGSTWSLMSFAPATTVVINAIACSSATSCVAVGSQPESPGSGTNVTAIEHWDGAQWTLVPSPPETSAYTRLLSVACPSESFCVASGNTYGSAPYNFIQRWDGETWSNTTMPPAGKSNLGLVDVACVSDVSCVAVGSYQPEFGDGRPLLETWDGEQWSFVDGPAVSDPGSQALLGVACSSAANCFAVGATDINATPQFHTVSYGLIERFDGTSWSVVPRSTFGPGVTAIRSVACVSDATCFALADRGKTALAFERWNGSTWAPAAPPPVDPAPSDARLAGVACATATTCFAVGEHRTTAHNNPSFSFIERSGPTGWSVDPSRQRGGASTSRLSGVSCPTAKLCFAVGTWSAYGAARTFVQRWNGVTWSMMDSPNDRRSTRPVTANRLTSVSCTSATNCFAVGTATDTSIRTLIEHWDGRAWTIVPSPNRAKALANVLEGVSCASATSCFAVGRSSQYQYGSPNTYKTLTVRWNGSVWKIVPSPNAASGVGELASVSCVADRACVAVGNAFRFALQQSLIEKWNGTGWTRVANTDPATATHSALTGVSCTSATSCVAVGSSYGKPKVVAALGKVSVGGRWTIAPGAEVPGSASSTLNAVSCPSAASCFAVGSYDSYGGGLTLVERYG